ncbi:hypothetical protein TNCT1_01120 [Streptomyces sp. 1-11]|nr:hypothetical protein TNCT1_01120 [Streptomyces sp. 1-11]
MNGSPVELSDWSPQARIAGDGQLQVNSNWSAAAKADLDLRCMVRTRDGRGGAIQPLGANFGSFDHWPYLELDQDDRTGRSRHRADHSWTGSYRSSCNEPLTRRNAWHTKGLRSRVRRFESCRGHPP